MKTIGIIGGVSWESTVLYYQLINQSVRDKSGGLNSANLIINSLNYSPIVQLEHEGNWNAVTEILIEAAQILENAGADILLLACNTLHKVAPAIEKAISIPFLHIADGPGTKFQQLGFSKIGLLGTQFTMEEGFYSTRLANRFDLQIMTPALQERQAIDKIIYQELCMGVVNSSSKQLLKNIMKTMVAGGAQGILLACTELGLIIKPEDAPVNIVDTTFTHVETAVSLAI